mmetsp:Transcript_3160/g.6536  ORF Transcript_3160/g.6536 Transcript_3160/m.6536 type:complete len:167 (+) Transcript_3160:541-1041(+)
MSWFALVENYLREKQTPEGRLFNCVECAAILGKLNGEVYASTPNFSLSQYSIMVPDDERNKAVILNVNEQENLLYCIEHQGYAPNVGGLRLNSEKYYFVRGDQDSRALYLRKSGGGACISWSNVCVIFASWSETEVTSGLYVKPQSAALCIEQVENLSDVLYYSNY